MSSLLQLFIDCASYHSKYIGKVAYQMGTVIAIQQLCFECGHKRVWTSQPRIRDTPAGNILLSVSMLYKWSNSWKGTEADESYQQLNNLLLSTMIPSPIIICVRSPEQSRLLTWFANIMRVQC